MRNKLIKMRVKYEKLNIHLMLNDVKCKGYISGGKQMTKAIKMYNGQEMTRV